MSERNRDGSLAPDRGRVDSGRGANLSAEGSFISGALKGVSAVASVFGSAATAIAL
jgi:hypothetical protein